MLEEVLQWISDIIPTVPDFRESNNGGQEAGSGNGGGGRGGRWSTLMGRGGAVEPRSSTTNTNSDAGGTGLDGTTIYLCATKEAEEDRMMSLFLTLIENSVKIAVTVFLLHRCAEALRAPRTEHLSKARKILKAKLPHREDLDFGKLHLTEHEMVVSNDVVAANKLSTTFSSIGGMAETKAEIRDIVTLACSYAARQQGLYPPRGILLSGVPGTGKTMLAKAVAKESGATFINVSLSALNSKWVGDTEKYICAIFSLASKLAPSIIFIDEIDGFLRCRSGMDTQHALNAKTEFMTQWDGLLTERTEPVIVLGVTNRPAAVDPAILRRLPRQFEIGLPATVEEREDILSIVTREYLLNVDVSLHHLARQTAGYSGSDLSALCQAAQTVPAREFAQTLREQEPVLASPEESAWLGVGAGGWSGSSSTPQMRAITRTDFDIALRNVRPTGELAQQFAGHMAASDRGGRDPDHDDMMPSEAEAFMLFLARELRRSGVAVHGSVGEGGGASAGPTGQEQ